MEPLDIVLLADRVGIVAFAISGVAVGIRSRMDLFGLIALGMVTATGGGIVRDVLLDEMPRAIEHIDYLLLPAAASAGAIVAGALGWRAPGPVMRAADAAGTGAFAVTGALLAHEAGLGWAAGVLLAIVTATGGGVIRDVLAREVPRVLHAELNATASAAGGLVAVAIAPERVDLAALAGAVVAASLSVAGHAGWVAVPRLGGESE